MIASLAFGYLKLLSLQCQQAFDDAPLFRIGLAGEQILKMDDVGTRNETDHDLPQLPGQQRPKPRAWPPKPILAILMHVIQLLVLPVAPGRYSGLVLRWATSAGRSPS
ncbi:MULTISPECIES: hypothetical protein [Mesorhizobium]|uniref:hypothetical protein n=1 Tax=Mesorhizobium TaxID=68287 RepID=UPI001F0A3F7C|nr:MULTISPECIES: hypothetical protein [Mesorhizobium]MCH4561240.1 hypothetical protein [Mesorhizobium jarvisii]